MLRAAALILLVAFSVRADLMRRPPKAIDLPFKTIQWKVPGAFVEGQRGLGDTFPYVALNGIELTPKSLKSMLRDKITTTQAAIDVVRLFVAGPLVTTEAKAKTMLEVGAALKKEFKYLPIKLSDHRPKSYLPSAVAWSKDEPTSWRVSLVAFEMDNVLRLVHVTAKVTAAGDITIKRQAMVDGPMTRWQSAAIGSWITHDQGGEAIKELFMRGEARVARERYAKALKPARDLDTAWVMARLRLGVVRIASLWGDHQRVVGRTRHLLTYDLKAGGAVVLSVANSVLGVQWFAHVKEAPAAKEGKRVDPGPVLHVLAQR